MKSLFGVLLAGASILALAAPVSATLQIGGTIGGTSFFCADNTGCDLNPATGVLRLADNSYSGVEVNGSIQTSTHSPDTAILNTSSLSVINNSGANQSITIVVGDTDYAGPVANFATAGSGTWQTAVGSTITLNWYDDKLNRQGASTGDDTPGNLIDTFTSNATKAADAFSHTDSGTVDDTGLSSMTLQATGLLTPGAQLLNRGQTEIKTAVAEPSSLLLMLGGLGLFSLVGGVGLRRREFPPPTS